MNNSPRESIIIPIITVIVFVAAIWLIKSSGYLKPNLFLFEQTPVEDNATDFSTSDLSSTAGDPFMEFNQYKKATLFQALKQKVITPNVVTKDFIINKSVKISTSGKFKDIYIFVEAATGNPLRNINQYESIYFYVDSGKNGGHLLRNKSLSMPAGNGAYTSLLYKDVIPLIQLPYDESKPPKSLDLKSIMNITGVHFVGGFVSTLSYGELRKITIGYTCETEGCSIK